MNINKDFIRFAISQLNFCLGDFEYNKKKILESIEYAKSKAVDILIFSEYSISGILPKDLLFRKKFLEKNKKTLMDIVENVFGINVIIGGIDFDFFDETKKNLQSQQKCSQNNKIYNTLFVISDKKIIAKYNKKFLQNYGNFDENKYFEIGNGEKNLICQINLDNNYSNCLLSIDGDFLHFDEKKLNDIDFIINLSAEPYYIGSFDAKKENFENFLKSKKVDIKIIHSNFLGGQDTLIFGGGSFVIDTTGQLIMSAKKFDEDFVIFDSFVKKNKIKLEKNNKLDICEILAKNENNIIEIETETVNTPHLKTSICDNESKNQEIYNALVFCLKDYFYKNDFKKAIIGLSGGIDSALVATISVDAIGKENVYCINMPSIYSTQGTKNDAKVLAKNLGVNFFEVPIEDLKNNYIKLFETNPAFKKENDKNDLAIENIQARIRGNILMSISNRNGGVVLSTGNKSEVATGYCTLYGDTVGSFCILQDVYKTKVFELAKFRNELARFELIPKSIINRKPSAELYENQTDQDCLPEYEILDKILELYIENNETLENIIVSIRQITNSEKMEKIVEKVINLVKISEHKRSQAHIGLKITKKSFGTDRLVPVYHKFNEF
ncbi:MAG: NAD+ synthase [Elusimicrobiota bacterium]|jgi:NAD+ synthase (glutamine-hydrolysing)|nr:NAD+ synthase [Elusimicrobiota bacterium]